MLSVRVPLGGREGGRDWDGGRTRREEGLGGRKGGTGRDGLVGRGRE